MSWPELKTYRDPLDLLWRFVPTPFRTQFRLDRVSVSVETNDFSLLPELRLNTDSAAPAPSQLSWKLVRDCDACGPLQDPLQLIVGRVTFVTMGPACLLGVDHQCAELFGFIGADIEPRTFQESLVPLLCRLSTEAVEATHNVRSEDDNDEVTEA